MDTIPSTNSSADNEFEAIKKRLQEMERRTEAVFAELAISPHQLHHFLNDPERCPPAVRDLLEKQTAQLDEILNRRIQETHNAVKQTATSEYRPGGHWVLMR